MLQYYEGPVCTSVIFVTQLGQATHIPQYITDTNVMTLGTVMPAPADVALNPDNNC
jgi:hypothetical protein